MTPKTFCLTSKEEIQSLHDILSLLDRDWTFTELPILKACNQFLMDDRNSIEEKKEICLILQLHYEMILHLAQHQQCIKNLKKLTTEIINENQ